VVISASTYFAHAPGPADNDSTIVSTTLGTSTGATASHAYASAGAYPIVLTVTDSNSVSAQDVTTATIASTSGGPVARAGGPYSGTAGAGVAMDGSASTGALSSYQWRLGDEVVLRATDVAAADIHGRWAKVSDSTAAGGTRIENADQGNAKISTAASAPANYFEVSFDAAAQAPYRLWIRMKAAGNSYSNDSIYVQFDDSTDSSGNAQYRLGTTSAVAVVLEEGSGGGISGWGWNDGSYGSVAAPIYFANAGHHRIRIQQREDGTSIDQIVLSADAYMDAAPGPSTNDTQIVSQSLGTSQGVTATHPYRWAGTYPVTLTVTDTSARTSSAATTATIR
jgi:PKD repeat protein